MAQRDTIFQCEITGAGLAQPAPGASSKAKGAKSVPGLVCQLSPPTNIFLQYKRAISGSIEPVVHSVKTRENRHVPRVVGHL